MITDKATNHIVDMVDIVGSGSYQSVALDPGTYSLFMGNWTATSLDRYEVGTTTGSINAFIAFAINDAAPVPEPATWSMMIVGLGMVGGSMRYRRRDRKLTLA